VFCAPHPASWWLTAKPSLLFLNVRRTDAIREIARVAADMNKTVENIGARRLFPVIEKIVEDISFDSPEMDEGTVISVDKEMVVKRLEDMLKKDDLSRFIL